MAYGDDASRLVNGRGVFRHIATENTITVPEEAIAKYGKPTPILADPGSQFYAEVKGASVCEQKLVEPAHTGSGKAPPDQWQARMLWGTTTKAEAP